MKGNSAYLQLKGRIVRHDLAPGQLLHEPELMGTLGFGRTPIREAIQRLASEKLVVARHRQTAFVAPILASDVSELVEMRLILECPSARLAAVRGTGAARARLRKTGEAFRDRVKARDVEGSFVADAAIHGLIASMAGNAMLAENFERTAALSHRLFWILIEREMPGKTFVSCHDPLVEAVCSGDPDAAARAAEDHIKLFQARLSRFLTSGMGGIGPGDPAAAA